MANATAEPAAQRRAAAGPTETPLETSAQAPPARVLCAARGITKAFGQNPILRGVDLEIAEGAFAVLVGPSGCGKSTLLRLVAGLEQPDAGTISLAGRDVTAPAAARPRRGDGLPELRALPAPDRPREPRLRAEARGRPSRRRSSRASARPARCSALDALLERLPKQLSGGQRQRVAMGRAIVRRPSIFLFDEPLSNLDAALRAEVRVEIRRLHDRLGATTLYVTHDQVEAMTLADTLWVMNGGLVEQKGAPLEVYERPRTQVRGGLPRLAADELPRRASSRRKDGAWRGRRRGRRGAAWTRIASATRSRRTRARSTLGVRPHDFEPLRCRSRRGDAEGGARRGARLRGFRARLAHVRAGRASSRASRPPRRESA